LPFNGEPGRIRTFSDTIWKRIPLASRDSDSIGLEHGAARCAPTSVGGKQGNRTLEPYGQPISNRCPRPCRTLSKSTGTFPGGQVHARFLPYSKSLGSIEPLRFPPRAIERITWRPRSDSNRELLRLQRKPMPSGSRSLGKGAGFEPAQRHCRSEETRFLRQVTNPLEHTSHPSRQPVHPKPATVFDLCHTCSVCR
jgi:hypothetical protein